MLWDTTSEIKKPVPEFGLEVHFTRPGANTLRACEETRRQAQFERRKALKDEIQLRRELLEVSGRKPEADEADKEEEEREQAKWAKMTDEEKRRARHDARFSGHDAAELIFRCARGVVDVKSGDPAFDVSDLKAIQDVPDDVLDAVARVIYDEHFVRADGHRGN